MSFISDPTRLLIPILKLTAYKKVERSVADLIGSVLLPYDQKSLKNGYQNTIKKQNTLGTTSGAAEYTGAADSCFKVTFVLDDATYSNPAAFPLPKSLVSDRVDKVIEKLISLTHAVVGETHAPTYVSLKALDMPFAKDSAPFYGRLQSMNVENINIDSFGNRIRALVHCSFVESLSEEQRKKRDNMSSPDLTHKRMNYAGDTLLGKTYSVYNDYTLAAEVAKFNGLNTLRKLNVGDSLLFPPLEN